MENRCSHVAGMTQRSRACCARRRDDCGLKIRTRIDEDRLARVEAFRTGDLEVGCTRGRPGRQSRNRLRPKSIQLLPVSAPSGNRPALALMATGATTVDHGSNTEPGAGT